MTGALCKFMAMGGTIILYGLLSEQPISGIDALPFLAKGLCIESFFLGDTMKKMDPMKALQFTMKASKMFTTDLATVVQKRYGLHEINDAITFYKANQTGGKILLQPGLTKTD